MKRDLIVTLIIVMIWATGCTSKNITTLGMDVENSVDSENQTANTQIALDLVPKIGDMETTVNNTGDLNEGEGIAPDIDITDCDTYTQIVDTKLQKGMGYANVRIGGQDVLLVSSGCFDNGGGHMSAIDATIYRYTEEGTIQEVGKVACGGTAYPISVKDEQLICGANHWLVKDTIVNDKIETVEEAWVDYTIDDGIYYFGDDNGVTNEISDTHFYKLFNVYDDVEIVEFSVVQD